MIGFIKKIVDTAKTVFQPDKGGVKNAEKSGSNSPKSAIVKTDENSLTGTDFNSEKSVAPKSTKSPRLTGSTTEGSYAPTIPSLFQNMPVSEPIEKLTSGDEIPPGHAAYRVENPNGSAAEIVVDNEDRTVEMYVYNKSTHKLPAGQITTRYLETGVREEIKAFNYSKSEYTIIERDESGKEISRETKELTGEKALLGKEQAKQDFIERFVNIDAENLMFLMEQGLVTEETRHQIPDCASLTPELLSDIELARQAQEEGVNLIDAYIPTLKSLDESSKVKNGDVFEVDGKLYISPDGEEKIELNISKEDYFQLFPPMKRFLGSQGNVADCYLVTVLMEKYKDPYGRAEMLTSISKQGDDFLVKLNNTDISVLVPKGETDYVTNPTKVVDGCEGLQMFEYAFGISLMDKSAQEKVQQLSEDISQLLDSDQNNIMEYTRLRNSLDEQATFNPGSALDLRGNGGNPWLTDCALDDHSSGMSPWEAGESLSGMLFATAFPKNIEYDSVDMFGEVESRTPEQAILAEHFEKMRASIEAGDRSAPENVAYFGGTKSPIVIDGNAGRLEQNLLPEKDIYSNHAYQCIPREDGTIDVINPWYYGFSMNLSQQEFDEHFSHVFMTKYKGSTPVPKNTGITMTDPSI